MLRKVKNSLLSLKNIIVLSLIFLLLALFSILPWPWNNSLDNYLIDIQFKLRGSRTVSEDIVIVFIGDEDIKVLKDWPITRDYYSYLIYILNTLQARVIGIDILLAKPDRTHPEYDRILSDFIFSTGNICLPFVFTELTLPESGELINSKGLFQGHGMTLPLATFTNHSAGLGFSNFDHAAALRKVPLAATSGDSVVFSFGLELFRLYLGGQRTAQVTSDGILLQDANGEDYTIPTDDCGRLRLNHFGDVDKVRSISLVDLMQTFEKKVDTLDLKDKLVVVAFTAAGIANLKTTPLSTALPASLIHLTVAENCIKENFLTEVPKLAHVPILILLVLLAVVAWNISIINIRIIVSAGLVLLYVIVAMVLFSTVNLVVPLFYPLLAFFSTHVYLRSIQRRQQESSDFAIKQLLQEQIMAKGIELEETRDKLTEMARHLEHETQVSDQVRQLANERKETILKLEKELNDLQIFAGGEVVSSKSAFSEIIHAENSRLKTVLDLIAKVSGDDIPVLILGETGTGKEMIAKAIHQSSPRKVAPFVAVNCGALSEMLLESELFGHEKGSFTGAQTSRRGRFEIANGGTFFLDEITETSAAFQVRLLRVLQEHKFERVGGEQTINTDVRIITATNKNINQEMEQNRFRADLFYRLNGFPITLPPLRERPEDIPLLATFFLKKHRFTSLSGISDQAMQLLQSYNWPGNVRELENIIRRAALLAQSVNRNLIRESDLPEELTTSDSLLNIQTIHKPLDLQILEILRMFKFSHNAISQTARILGNRDRGTITEYFRGICFEHLVKADFNMDLAASKIAATSEKSLLDKVKLKIQEYLNNIKYLDIDFNYIKENSGKLPTPFQGLPKKYHIYLQRILEHYSKR